MLDLVGTGLSVTPQHLVYGLIASLLYASFVVWLIWRSKEYTTRQLILQGGLALMVPFVGALLVHFMFLATQSKEPVADKNHIPRRHENEPDIGHSRALGGADE